MTVARMDHEIIIQEPITSRNSRGEAIVLWTELDTVLARFRPLRGEEKFAAAQVTDKMLGVFTIHHRTDVDRTMRILHRNLAFYIESIKRNRGKRRSEGLFLEILAWTDPSEVPRFEYFNLAVAEGSTALTASFTWNTTAKASTKARYREVGGEWTTSSETDTSERVIDHSYTTPVLEIGKNYEIQPWGENAASWSPGWGASTTFYWDCDSTFHLGTFSCPAITISEEAVAGGGAAYYVTITYTTDMLGSTRVRYKETGGEWTTLDEKDTAPRVTNHAETFGPLDGEKNYEGEVWTENCCGNTDGWQGALTWGIDTDGTFLPGGYSPGADIVFSDIVISKHPFLPLVQVGWTTDPATKGKLRWRIMDSGDAWVYTSLDLNFITGHNQTTGMTCTPGVYYEYQLYGITEGAYEEWDILRYIKVTVEGIPEKYVP